jgi:hypothetical protein
LIHGVYSFGGRRVAYRGDFCLNCQRPCVAERLKTLDVVHLCFIPMVPIGYWKHWCCPHCGNDPSERTKSSKRIKKIGAVVFLPFVVTPWFVDDPKIEPEGLWAARIGFLLGYAALLYSIKNHREPLGPKEGRRLAATTPKDSCYYCGGPLDAGEYCLTCDVYRHENAPAGTDDGAEGWPGQPAGGKL